MKRKQAMRVLAVALAASVAVATPGIPAGLTTVYAISEAATDITLTAPQDATATAGVTAGDVEVTITVSGTEDSVNTTFTLYKYSESASENDYHRHREIIITR